MAPSDWSIKLSNKSLTDMEATIPESDYLQTFLPAII